MRKDKKTRIIFIFTIVGMILTILAGFTYAYFTSVIEGNEEANISKFSTCTFDLDFTTSEYITNNSAELIAEEDIETKADNSQFTVTNSSDCSKTAYTLSLTDIVISSNLKSSDFKWRLEKNGEILYNGNFANIGSNTTMELTTSNQTLTRGNQDRYILRVWLEETTSDQSVLYNGSFSAKVSMNAKTSK